MATFSRDLLQVYYLKELSIVNPPVALKEYSKLHTLGGLQGLQLVLPFFSTTQEAKQLTENYTNLYLYNLILLTGPLCFKSPSKVSIVRFKP